MSSTGGSAPPIFADINKFDGVNWVAWSGLIRIAAEVRGVFGYLDGTIVKPTVHMPVTTTAPPTATITTTTTTTTTPTAAQAPTAVPLPPDDTPWDSLTPSGTEWKVRNAWAKGLLIFNTKNPISLGVNISRMAADAWKSYLDQYEAGLDIALLNAEQDLRDMRYSDSDNFPNHISLMRTKWAYANALGANISDTSFRTIVLNSLPCSWDAVIASLYSTKTSVDAISQLNVHWLRINHDRIQNPTHAVTALQATPNNHRQRSQLVCSNPNCKRKGHTIEICYWPGSGKEGQFPPGFGKRGGVRGTASNTH